MARLRSGKRTGKGRSEETPPLERVALTPQMEVPVLPLAGSVVLPWSIHPLSLQGEQASKLVEAAQEGAGLVALFQERAGAPSSPTVSDLHDVGTMAALSGIERHDDGRIDLEAQGIAPVRLLEVTQWDPYVMASVLVVDEK